MAFGIRELQSSVFWIAERDQVKLNMDDPEIASEIRSLLNSNRKIRIIIDVCCSLLMLNPIEAVPILNELIEEVKQYNAMLWQSWKKGCIRRSASCDATTLRRFR